MSSDQGADPDSLEDLHALIGTGPVPFPARADRVFQPWHRPRKQYVRGLQWARELRYLARDLHLESGELRYLTLPGSDLLDIRYIAQTVCAPNMIRLRYLGFNTAASPASVGQAEVNSSQFALNRFDSIHPESEVFPGDLRHVADTSSISWERVHRAGPFHAINLDLCGGFAGEERTPGLPNYFTALQALLQNQAESDEDFLLFITTRMDEASVSAEARRGLDQVALKIRATCERYAQEFSEAWGLAGEDLGRPTADVVSAGEAFMLGLTQWIVTRGVALGLKASVRSFMTYRTGSTSGEDDLLSLAIRFSKSPYILADDVGLVRPHSRQLPADARECEQSANIPSRVVGRTQVDEVLRREAEKFQRCLQDSCELLSSAGYDEELYRNWVMEESDRYATA